MISLSKIRELDLSAAACAGRPLHLSAASGLVRAGRFPYVVADDELHLGVFGSNDTKAGYLARLFAGALPAPAPERKARKPDLEALTLLPSFAGYPHGALFALGSGSTRDRRMGALLALDAQGEAGDTPRKRSSLSAGASRCSPRSKSGSVRRGSATLLSRSRKATARS